MKSTISGGLAGFSSTITSMERRQRGVPADRMDKSKKLKPTREELEMYDPDEMDDFIDDSELIEAEDEEAEDAQPGAFKAVATDMDDASSASSRSMQSPSERVSSRAAFLERWNTWNPPPAIMKDLIELKRLNALAFGSAGLSKLSPKIESLLHKIDRAATAMLPSHKRTKPYLAKMVHVFPPPMTRAHVVAHIRRLALKSRVDEADKRVTKLTQRCASAIQLRLARLGAVVQPPVAETAEVAPLPTQALTTLRQSQASGAAEDAALDDVAQWAAAACKLLNYASLDALRDASRVLVAWSQRVRPVSALRMHAAPSPSFVAAREWVHTATCLAQGQECFVWDGESRALASRIGHAILRLCRRSACYDAWLSGRARELQLPSSSRQVALRSAKHQIRSLPRLFAKSERALAKVFASAELRRTAKLNVALRELDAFDFFEYDVVAAPAEPVLVAAASSASLPLPAQANGHHAAPGSSPLRAAAAAAPAKPSPSKESQQPAASQDSAIPVDADGAPKFSPIHAPAGDFVFSPVKGTRFDTKKFDANDFPPVE